MTTHDSIHVVDYGESGSGKSTFAATFPTPGLLLQFDPLDKAGPYLRRGIPGPLQLGPFCPFREVTSKKTEGKLLWRIEYFHDVNLGKSKKPQATAYQSFRRRVDALYDEIGQWKTVVIDSTTYMEIAARKLDQYTINPNSKDPRQWYAASTETLEEMLMCTFANFPCNVVVLAHTASDKKRVRGLDDTMVMTLAAPGRLARVIPSGYGEIYRSYVASDDEGQIHYRIQTQASDEYVAASQIGAPNPAPAHYAKLWRGASDAS